MFNKHKKVYFGLSLIVLLISALGMVIATGWDSSKPSHDTLYTDEIRGKSGSTVTVNDVLNVETASDDGAVVKGMNTKNNNYGTLGDYDNGGVYGFSENMYGVQGYSLNSHGVLGQTMGSGDDAGVYGAHTSGNYGFLGSENYGVYGEVNNGYAVYGKHTGSSGAAVIGYKMSGSDINSMGFLGGSDEGVRGSSTNGKGVYGVTSSGISVFGYASSSSGYSAKFSGGQGVAIVKGGLCVDSSLDCDPDEFGKGKVIAEDTPDKIKNNPKVLEAYLGE